MKLYKVAWPLADGTRMETLCRAESGIKAQLLVATAYGRPVIGYIEMAEDTQILMTRTA